MLPSYRLRIAFDSYEVRGGPEKSDSGISGILA